MSDLQSAINELANHLTALIESQAMEQARATVLAAFRSPTRRGPRPLDLFSMGRSLCYAALLEDQVTRMSLRVR